MECQSLLLSHNSLYYKRGERRESLLAYSNTQKTNKRSLQKQFPICLIDHKPFVVGADGTLGIHAAEVIDTLALES
jgi:hypothetical protein